jgi:hypothetical protein
MNYDITTLNVTKYELNLCEPCVFRNDIKKTYKYNCEQCLFNKVIKDYIKQYKIYNQSQSQAKQKAKDGE